MISEKKKEEFKKLDEELDKQLNELWGFDKYDEIVLSKEKFKYLMGMTKMLYMANQMKAMTSHFKDIKI